MQYLDSHKKIDWVLERISALRDAVGMDLDVGIDFHGRLHKLMAKVLAKELGPFRPMFIEEPVHTKKRLKVSFYNANIVNI